MSGMHLCPDCDSDLVHPIAWNESPNGWTVFLRCPNCDWIHEGEYDQKAVDAFEEELERGEDVLHEYLQCLVKANMADDVDRFSLALMADHVLPEDF